MAVVSTIATVIVTLRRRPVTTSRTTKSVLMPPPREDVRRRTSPLSTNPVDTVHVVAHELAHRELDDPAAHGVDDGMVVGGHEHRRARAVDPLQQQHDVLAGVRVQVAGGL